MLPVMKTVELRQKTLHTFGGLNLTGQCGAGEFSRMENLSADSYPALGVRGSRATWYETDSSGELVRGIFETDAKGITAAECVCGKLVFCTADSVYYDGEILAGATLDGSERHSIIPFGRGFFILPENLFVSVSDEGAEVLQTDAPVMDFAVCHKNRLFGCRYGANNEGSFVNEIYACSQGNPTQWMEFGGISTDSYVASVGISGNFTGMAVCRDSVLFFKESAILSLTGTNPADFYLSSFPCEGAEEGSSGAIVNIGELVYYRSRAGISVFDGASTRVISEKLGVQPFTVPCAGAINNKYYCAMTLGSERTVFVYDTVTSLWHREKGEGIRFFVRRGNCLIAVINHESLVRGGALRRLWSFAVTDSRFAPEGVNLLSDNSAGGSCVWREEGAVGWSFTTGPITAGQTMRGRVKEVVISLGRRNCTELKAGLYADDSSDYRELKTIAQPGRGLEKIRCFIPPCDSFRLCLSGKGECEISSITFIYEERNIR